jgi:hypothetical protein
VSSITYEGLQPEIFSEELTWLEFFEALSETVEEQIRSPIKELETIRDIIETSDPVIVANSIRQMGFDIPIDIIQHNVDRLARAIYMLPLFHETSGTTEFTKAISFVLGRETIVHDLYTKDYVDFYRQPYGPLNIDGGDWYKATHIGLAMEMISTDKNLIVAENQTIKDRLIDAFYEFAPINLVIHNFRFLIQMKGSLDITGTMFVRPDRFYTFGNGVCNRNLVIEAPSRVREATDHMIRVGYSVCDYELPAVGLPAFFTNTIGIDTDIEISSSNLIYLNDDSSPQQFTIDIDVGQYGYFVYPAALGVAVFTGISSGFENITGGWDGATWPNDGTVGQDTGPLLITRTVDNVTSQWYLHRTDFPSTQQNTFEVEFPNEGAVTNGTIAQHNYVPIYSVDMRANKTSLVGFSSNGKTSFGLVSKDTTVVITAYYKGLVARKEIIIEAYNDDIVAIDIVGPDTVLRGNVAQYTPVGVFKDGQRGEIECLVKLVSPYAVMDANNQLSVFDISESVDIFLSAEYVSRSGARVISSKKVSLKYIDPNVYLVSLEATISQVAPSSAGAQAVLEAFLPDDELYEGDERTLTAVATFSDNSTKVVQPIWKSSSPSLYVATNGLATAGYTEGELHVSVDATFQYRGIKAVARKVIKVIKEETNIESLRILGATTVVELSRSQFSAIATWTDGTVTSVEAEWATNKFNISSSGVFDAGSVDSPLDVTITARADGKVATFIVVVVDTPVLLQNLNIIGPNNVTEDIVAQYTAYAHYSNNTDIEITPVWSIVGNINNISIDTDGKLVFTGISVPALIEVKATYIIGIERYIQTKPVVLVPKTSIITALLISGPNEVDELGRIFLTATAVYEDGSLEVVNPKWTVQPIDAINETETMADVISPGVVQGRVVAKDTKVVVLAHYFKEVAEHVVVVKNRALSNTDTPLTSRIIGPPVVKTTDVGSYAQAIEFENGCGETLVSSSWSLDVSPEVALIDDDGYLHSVNGAGVPVTISAVYSCGNFEVTDTFLVTLIATQSPLSNILISGPASVMTSTEHSYFAELIRQGVPQIPGSGETLPSSSVEWSILGGAPVSGIALDAGGRLYIDNNVPDNTTFTITATYSEGFDTVSGQLTINVTKLVPVFGTGPIGVSDSASVSAFLTSQLPTNASGQSISLNIVNGQYGYFAHPADLGVAVFSDNNAPGFIGGWDGATWPNDGTIGQNLGPLSISRTINGFETVWYLYRTDFAALGMSSYLITFI